MLTIDEMEVPLFGFTAMESDTDSIESASLMLTISTRPRFDFMEVGTPLHAALVLQADELAAERGADINAIAKDFDDADPVHTSDLVLGRVVRELHGRGAMARLVDFGWSFSAERLLLPDIVEG